MTSILPRRALLAGAAATLPLARPRAQPAAWPERPVRIIVPFPPGQAADIVTRLVADALSQRWPQRVVVENRGGGAGAPALEAGARATPDGYTLIAGTSGTLGINPSVLPNLPYDAVRDFAPISNVALVPLLMTAHPSFQGDVRSVVTQARAKPGELNIASAGPATSQHLATELLAHQLGIRFNIVHYRGSGPAIADLVAGNIPLMMDSVASALGNIRGGRVRALAVCSPKRLPWLPEVPSFAEAVAPGYEAFGWTGLVAPAATPAEIIRKVNADAVEVLRDPGVAQRLGEQAVLPDPTTPEAFGAFVRAEIVKWGEVARIANVKLEG